MIVRSFQLSDYASITQFLQTELADEVYDETIEAFGNQLKWDSDLVLVAEAASGGVLGVIIGTIDNNNGYYYRTAVRGEQHADQRDRTAESLILALQGKFQQRGVSKILVTVDEYNEALLHLFERLGFNAKDYLRSLSKLSIVNS